MNRRYILRALGLAGISTCTPVIAMRALGTNAPVKHLVLIELNGGNDGLNTVIPYADNRYYQLRPAIGVKREKVLQLDEKFGLHPALKDLNPLWADQDMAIIHGVGYPDPNRSHFRSIEIWETASAADETLLDGWLTPITEHLPVRNSSGIKAVALADDQGPLAGANNTTVVFDNLKRFVQQSKQLKLQQMQSSNAALKHILDVQQATKKAGIDFAKTVLSTEKEVKQLNRPGKSAGRLANELATVARLIRMGAGPQIFKVGLGSFDTHYNQSSRHSALLKQLATGVKSFRESLTDAGEWGNVLVMTYSEFGRRAGENGSKGTDHGTAAPQFIFGGQVKGGFYGEHPSLANLENGDLRFGMDFRSVYATVARDWLGVSAAVNRFERLGFVG